jgi:hypothetical protein
VLLDETGSAEGISARHRCGRTDQDPNFAIRQYPEQAETEPSTKVAKPGVALTPLPARREASGQPNFVASGRPVDPLQDELEIEGQLEFADHDDRQIIALQRDQIAASNLALDDKTEPFEEDLDRPRRDISRIVLTSDRFIPAWAFSSERPLLLNRRTESPWPRSDVTSTLMRYTPSGNVGRPVNVSFGRQLARVDPQPAAHDLR